MSAFPVVSLNIFQQKTDHLETVDTSDPVEGGGGRCCTNIFCRVITSAICIAASSLFESCMCLQLLWCPQVYKYFITNLVACTKFSITVTLFIVVYLTQRAFQWSNFTNHKPIFKFAR